MVYRPPDVPSKTCSLCSKEYNPKHSTAKYCCRDCGRLTTALATWVHAHFGQIGITRGDKRRMVASLLRAVRHEMRLVRVAVPVESP